MQRSREAAFVGMTRTSHVLFGVAASLALAGIVFLVAIGASLIGTVWFAVTALVAAGTWALRGTPRWLRILLAAALVPALVILTFEGGLFFVPAAFALALAHTWTEPQPPSDRRTTMEPIPGGTDSIR